MTETATAPSVGADETKAPSPSAATEDAILDRMEQDRPAEEPSKTEAPEATAAGEETPSAEAEPKVEEEPEPEEPELETRPELPDNAFQKYKEVQVVGEDGKSVPLFKAFPELKRVLGRHEAFSELGSITELRELREKFPAAEDVQRILEQAEESDRLIEAYRTDTTAFAEKLMQTDRQAFDALAQKFPLLLYQANPQLYAQQRREDFHRTLDNLWRKAQESGDVELTEAAEQIALKGMGIRLGQAIAPKPASDPEKDELRRKLEERDKADRASAYNNFVEATENEYAEKVLAQLDPMVKKAFTPQGATEPAIGAEALKRIVNEIWESVQDQLKNQPQTVDTVRRYYKSAAEHGKTGPQEHKALVEFMVKRASLVLASTSKSVISKWTKDILGAKKRELEKKQTVANQTKEPKGAGAPAAKPGGQPTAKPAARRSEDEILSSLSAGTYQPAR